MIAKLPLKIILLILFGHFSHINAQSDEQKLEKELRILPNVTFTKISQPKDTYLKYSLAIQQPLDHTNPAKGSFSQYIILTHKGFDQPTVMETQGYALDSDDNEVELILHANNLNIEHRFFGKSIPDSMQWEYLSFEQAAEDLHYINQLLKIIYKSNWISTGVSKGGVTAIYYKYFYPNDVSAAVPYVSPINNSLEDKRIYNFLDTIGSVECRKNIYTFQEFMLQHENEALDKLKWFSLARHLQFNYIGSMGKAFEYSILEYAFAFWQEGMNCTEIPSNKNVDTYLEHLLKCSDLSMYSDQGIKLFESHYYQAATEGGYYGYNIGPFKKDLHFVSTSENPSAIFYTPRIINHKPFNDSLLKKVSVWAKEKGNNIIYIYGATDTWSACRVVLSDKVNSRVFLIPNVGHPEARIKNMPKEMQQSFRELLQKFTSSVVTLEALK